MRTELNETTGVGTKNAYTKNKKKYKKILYSQIVTKSDNKTGNSSINSEIQFKKCE